MGNLRSILRWLREMLMLPRTPVASQPRCSCGRFCSTHEAPPDATAKLVSELTSQGLYVPARFLSAQEGRGQQ